MMEQLIVFFMVMAATWFVVIRYLPWMVLRVYKQAILNKGFEDGPVPINTLYTQSPTQFDNPFDYKGSYLATTGTNRDTLLTVGWLDLEAGPQVLRVPEMTGRYYSIQFTNPMDNTNFAYVGKRTTGTAPGTFIITGPGWKGEVPKGMSRISAPNNSVLVIGRVAIGLETELSLVHELSKQFELEPLAKKDR